jgi:hypothetical protein
MESKAYEFSMLSVCQFMCPPLITFELIGRFSRNSVGWSAIDGDLNAIISNPVAVTVLKWRSFNF